MREAFAMQKHLIFFSTKIGDINVFINQKLTNDNVSFEQPGPDLFFRLYSYD